MYHERQPTMNWTVVFMVFLAFGPTGISGGWSDYIVASRRSTESSNSDVYELVADVLTKAKSPEGIAAADLGQAANDLVKATDAILNDHEFPEESTKAIIEDVAKDFKCTTALFALFTVPLVYEASMLDSALCVLGGLVAQTKTLKESGESVDPVLAAISMTAAAIEISVGDSKETIKYISPYVEKPSSVSVRHPPDYYHGSCSGGFTYFKGFCYAYIHPRKTWAVAQGFCRALGGFLAEIFTPEENDFVQQMARNNGGHEVWLGASDLVKHGEWYWANSGRSFTSFNDWAPGQPDKDNEHCLEMLFALRLHGHWSDGVCSHQQRFICQKYPDIDNETSRGLTETPQQKKGGHSNRSTAP